MSQCSVGVLFLFILKLDSYFVRVYARVYAGIRWTVHTPSVQFCARIRAYVRQRVQPSWTFKAGVDISSNQMRLRGSRSTHGYRRPGAYAHTFILIIHNASARRNICPRRFPAWRVYACWWSQKVWIQLYKIELTRLYSRLFLTIE